MWSRDKSRHARGYGSKWVKLRRAILARDLWLCQVCLDSGRPTQATEVDHIEPKANGGTDDPDNLRAICSRCHAIKTRADNGGQAAPRPWVGEGPGPDWWR